MGEVTIKTHDFEKAKLSIKKFSQTTKTDMDLQCVRENKSPGEWLSDFFFGGGIGTSRKVTGEELNELTLQIQVYLESLNKTQIKLIKQFGKVYDALEALDKDYIYGILCSVEATKKTSEGVAAAQVQIKKTVETQKKTLEMLKKFKEKMDSYTHLKDIDALWEDCQKWNAEIASVSDIVSKAVAAVKETTGKTDEMNRSLETVKDEVSRLFEHLEQQNSRLESMSAFLQEIESIAHWQDIDTLWIGMENAQTDISNLCSTIEEVKQEMAKQQDLAVEREKTNGVQQKIKLLSWLAGSSLVLGIVSLILTLLR